MPLGYNTLRAVDPRTGVITNTRAYAWTHGSPRPAKPLTFTQVLVVRFLESSYARETSLADFLRAHPNALTTGVLNQLHRRHIIPWDLIKGFTAKAAATDFSRDLSNLLREVYTFFGVTNAPTAEKSTHGHNRALQWETIANAMCWVDDNVFVGPSAGNYGVHLDLGDELTDGERTDLLRGAAWRSAERAYSVMHGFFQGTP
jgi:hypothetical protein